MSNKVTIKDIRGYLRVELRINREYPYLVEGGKKDYFRVYLDKIYSFKLNQVVDKPYIKLRKIEKSPKDKPGQICIVFESQGELDYE